MDKINKLLKIKRKRAKKWSKFFKEKGFTFFEGTKETKPNFWLYTLIMKNESEKVNLLKYLNNNNILARPSWELMHKLPMFKDYQCSDLNNSEWLSKRIVNLPSSPKN